MKFDDYREKLGGFEEVKDLSRLECQNGTIFESNPSTWDTQLLDAVTRLEERVHSLEGLVAQVLNSIGSIRRELASGPF